jgi:hypothetical protein
MATIQRETIQPVATCRQTVEAYLATPHHRLAADGYHSARNNSARSHLSPDGGSLIRHANHRLAADGYVSAPNNSARSHLSPDGGSLPRHAYHRLAAAGDHSGSKGIRQSVEEYALNQSNETIPWTCGCTKDKSLRARRASL